MIVQAAFDSSAQSFSLIGFFSAILRTALMIYLLASATSRFDKTKLPLWEAFARFAFAILLISPDLWLHGSAAVGAFALIAFHYMTGKSSGPTAATA